MNNNNDEIFNNYKGLNDDEVLLSREKNGPNRLSEEIKEPLIIKILKIFKEPMFLLLIIAASVYFIVGEYIDGIIMLVFVIGICLTEFIQETKTDKALKELNKLSSLNVKVIRNGGKVIITSDEIVVNDIVILEEGDKIPADGKILYCQSLGVNESILTGESATVYKNTTEDKDNHFKTNICYSGTDVVNGMAIIEIISVGKNTEYGHIGETLNEIKATKTPLEIQINKLVFICAIISGIIFILTIVFNFFTNSELLLKERIVTSIISGITIAMATIPEEIPVIFTVFLAMGAWDLTNKKALTRNMYAIETLGAINVLCTDKTGTLTENKMTVQEVYAHTDSFYDTAYYACQNIAFDPMEAAIKDYCQDNKHFSYNFVTKEYAFTTETKMMGLIWDKENLCVKGATENVLPLCNLDQKVLKNIKKRVNEYSSNGYRVLAVAKQLCSKTPPHTLSECQLTFEGLIALYDPPRKGIDASLNECTQAGIRVIMITGDNGETAKGIGRKINLPNCDEVIIGPELEKMTDDELYERVKNVNIFARVYPNHKMRIVNALQKDKKIVAMTGDGINDAPALKKADIGIAMGNRGTNVAKEAADIVLLDDNFNTIVGAIKNGRNIYKNIRKAISYIIVIHIPIALLSIFVPIFKLPALLLPIHVMLLELLIDPTSSIMFQRIKPSTHIMQEKPRKSDEAIINMKTAIKSIIQGLFIFLVVFINYYLLIKNEINTNLSITITYTILVLSIMLIPYQLKNSKLTIINLKDSFKDIVSKLINLIIIIGLILLIYLPIFNKIANTATLNLSWWLYAVILSLIAVIPFDILKIKKLK